MNAQNVTTSGNGLETVQRVRSWFFRQRVTCADGRPLEVTVKVTGSGPVDIYELGSIALRVLVNHYVETAEQCVEIFSAALHLAYPSSIVDVEVYDTRASSGVSVTLYPIQ